MSGAICLMCMNVGGGSSNNASGGNQKQTYQMKNAPAISTHSNDPSRRILLSTQLKVNDTKGRWSEVCESTTVILN